jgi:hypothetical protein
MNEQRIKKQKPSKTKPKKMLPCENFKKAIKIN